MPDFSKLHSLNTDANFRSVKFGADSVLLETELNELQDIQNERRADIIRDKIPSGFIKLSTIDYDSMKTTPNTIILKEESIAYVNGERIVIPAGTKISLPAPPSTGSRVDFVLLEVWKEEIDFQENIEKYGGEGQDTLTNYLKDSRVGVETSRRIQVKWRLRAVENASALTSVNAKGQLANESTTKFAKSSSDNGLYTATVTGASVDNVVYALPMFTVNRRNSGGYKVNNVNGALLYNERAVGYQFKRESVAYKSDGTKVGSNVPRIETVNGNDKAIMIEEGTTNLLQNPVFNNGLISWLNSGDNPPTSSISEEKFLGYNTVNITFKGNNSVFVQNVLSLKSTLNNQFITLSAWVKTNEPNKVRLVCQTDCCSPSNVFYGQAHSGSGNWEKLTLTFTPKFDVNGSTSYITFGLYSNYSDVSALATCFQLELKAYPTSFTDNTRQSDMLKIPNNVLNVNEGTIEIKFKKDSSIHSSNNSTWNFLFATVQITTNPYKELNQISIRKNYVNDKWGYKFTNSLGEFTEKCDFSLNDGWNVITLKWSKNNKTVSFFINGNLVDSVTNAKLPDSFEMNETNLGCWVGGFQLNSLISDFHISSIARTNEDIQNRATNGFTVDQYTTYSLKPQGDILLPTSGNLSYPKSVDTTNKRITFYVPNTTISKIDKPFTTFKNSMGSVAKIEDIVGNDVVTSVPELTTNNMDFDFNQLNNGKRADIIEEADIQDLRNTVSLTGFDYKSMGEAQFKEVIIGGQRRTVKEYIGRWKQFGVTGVAKSDNTGLNYPFGVVVDNNGYVYVTDYSNHRLIKLNPDLTYNSQFGVTGVVKTDNTGLNNPTGVAVDNNGYIYIIDHFNHRLVKLNPNLTYNSQFGVTGTPKTDNTGLYNPVGVAVDNNGYVYVADHSNHRLVKLNPDLTYNSQFGVTGSAKSDNTGLYNPVGVAVDSNGYIYITDRDNHRLVKLNPDLTFNSQYNQGLYLPRAVAVDENGYIYIYQKTKLIKLNPDMTYNSELFNSNVKYGLNLGSNDYWVAAQIAIKGNDFYIPDRYNHRLIKITNMPDDVWYDYNTKFPSVVLGNQDCDGIKTSFSDAPYFNYRTVSVPVSGDLPQGVTRTVAGSNWASNDTIKIKALRSKDKIMGTLDPNSAKAKILSINGTTVYLNNVTGISVNDTISYFAPDLTLGGTATVTAVDTTNKTVTLNTSLSSTYLNGYIFETTVGSSLPVVQFFNSSTKAWENVTGTWTGLGTNEATFTLGTNANLTNQDIKISYNIVSPGGEGLTFTPKEFVSCEADGEVLWKQFGVTGTLKSDNTGLSSPSGVTVDSQGYIYVADSGNHRVVKLNPDLTYNSQFGVTGVSKTDNTGFKNPYGVAVDSNGYIYVTDRYNHRLVKLNPDLTYNSQFGVTGVVKSDNTGLNNPRSVAVDSQGYVYVTDFDNHRLIKLNPDLTYNSQFGVTGVAKTDNTGFKYPYGVAVDSNGYVYVTDYSNHRLIKLNPDLTYNSQFGVTGVVKSDNTGLNSPLGVVVDSQGYIYVADSGNHRVVKLNPDLTYNSQFGVTGVAKNDNTGLNAPFDVEVDSNGYVYISDTSNQRLIKMHPNYLCISDFSRKAVTSLAPIDPSLKTEQYGKKPNVAIIYTTDVIFPADFSTGTYDIVWKSDRVYYTANGSYDSYTSTFRNIANKVMEVAGLENVNGVYPFELSQAQLNLKLSTDLYRAFIEDYNLENMSSITVENALSVLVSKSLGETIPYMALLPMIIKKDGQLYLLIKGMLTKSSTMNFTSNFQLIVPIKGNPLIK